MKGARLKRETISSLNYDIIKKKIATKILQVLAFLFMYITYPTTKFLNLVFCKKTII